MNRAKAKREPGRQKAELVLAIGSHPALNHQVRSLYSEQGIEVLEVPTTEEALAVLGLLAKTDSRPDLVVSPDRAIEEYLHEKTIFIQSFEVGDLERVVDDAPER